ncbi:hypothetical protein HY408_01525 [Candidatus Gottesmanbacteria bacterium]|nr:hypothetical protein [Candidatus Gottesmanbacteria bacterium]
MVLLSETDMEKQNNIGNLDNLQTGNNPVDPSVQNTEKLKTSYWIFSKFLFALLFITTVGWYALNSAQPPQEINPPISSPNSRASGKPGVSFGAEKMVSSEVTDRCQIRITTNQGREFYLNTAYETTDTNNSRCYQFLLNKISPSGDFLVYQDISGGVDSQLSVYTILNRNNEGHNLRVFGSATIKEIEFLPDDKLVALIGIAGDSQTWSLFSMDLAKLYEEYPKNYGKDNINLFTDTQSVEKLTNLPDKKKDYNWFTISFDTVRVETVSPEIEYVEYDIGDI